jgi:CheY-like chemotaxis protein
MATILVVDDEIVLKIMLGKILSLDNHEIVTADNGVSALAFLAENRVDLVITDIMMPEMDGSAFLEILRAEKSGKDLPVIVLTGTGTMSSLDAARQMGVERILSKPISSQELLQAIEETLGSSAPEDNSKGKHPQLGWT